MPFPKDRLVATEYQPFDNGQPPVHFGERTGIQSVITSPWVLRWASIPATYATYRQIRKHGTIAMARELKVAPVLASEWTIDADDDVPDEWKTLVEKTFFPLRDEFMAADPLLRRRRLRLHLLREGHRAEGRLPQDRPLQAAVARHHGNLHRAQGRLHRRAAVGQGSRACQFGPRRLPRGGQLSLRHPALGECPPGVQLVDRLQRRGPPLRPQDRRRPHRRGVSGRHVHRPQRQGGGKRGPGPHGPGQPGSGRRRGGPPRHGCLHAAVEPRISRLENLDPRRRQQPAGRHSSSGWSISTSSFADRCIFPSGR